MVFKLNPSWSGLQESKLYGDECAHLQIQVSGTHCATVIWDLEKTLRKIYLLIWLRISCGMWDLIPPSRDPTQAPCIETRVLATEPPESLEEKALGPDWLDSDPGSATGSVWFSELWTDQLLFQHLSFLIFTMRMMVFPQRVIVRTKCAQCMSLATSKCLMNGRVFFFSELFVIICSLLRLMDWSHCSLPKSNVVGKCLILITPYSLRQSSFKDTYFVISRTELYWCITESLAFYAVWPCEMLE